LGVSAGRRRRTTSIELCSGTLLAVFTDGLVERRGEVLDRGFARLWTAFTPQSAERSCAAAIAALMPAGGWADDAALLVIRRDGVPSVS
jgi:phosphoserine phosphatase RsbU/P